MNDAYRFVFLGLATLPSTTARFCHKLNILCQSGTRFGIAFLKARWLMLPNLWKVAAAKGDMEAMRKGNQKGERPSAANVCRLPMGFWFGT